MLGMRTNLFNICSKGLRVVNNNSFWPTKIASHEFASYRASREYNPNEKVDFEVSKNPKEWAYVRRLLPLQAVPEPELKNSYPSGWIPQREISTAGPYFVRRSRNHMAPVYLKTSHRGVRKITVVRHILGDIWLFTSDLKNFIEDQVKAPIGYKVDEVGCKISLRGDYVHYAEQFLIQKGF